MSNLTDTSLPTHIWEVLLEFLITVMAFGYLKELWDIYRLAEFTLVTVNHDSVCLGYMVPTWGVNSRSAGNSHKKKNNSICTAPSLIWDLSVLQQ